MKKLEGKKLAVLAADGVEHDELTEPVSAVQMEGATTEVISLKAGKIRTWKEDDWHDTVSVDLKIDDADAAQYDALLIPGGVMSPDNLRENIEIVSFIQSFFSGDTQKPVATICHGPWLLAEAAVLKGRKITSWPGIKTDLINAGADWVDKEVVVDQGLVTSRSPEDLDAFCSKIIEEMREGEHQSDRVAS